LPIAVVEVGVHLLVEGLRYLRKLIFASHLLLKHTVMAQLFNGMEGVLEVPELDFSPQG